MFLPFLGPAQAAEQVLFGPAQYTRSAGPPTQFQETIAVPATLADPFRLHIKNGNPDGSNRISSATITLNGTQIAGPSDFSQQVAAFDRTVTLQANNTLQVRLTSPPGGFLVLTLYGTLPPPTLTKLEPPTLPITPGGTGSLTATISAAQPTDTTITLSSSSTSVATVPATATVPAGQLSVGIPVTGVSPGTAAITATLNESTLQSTVTVQPTGPTLTSLTPATLQVTQGASGILTVTISAAQATDTVVALTSSNATIVGLPGDTITVPAGQASQSFAVFGNSPGQATITASLNGITAQSQVTVVIPLPTVVSLLPPVLPLTEGSTGSLTVTLSASQPTDTDVFLSRSDPTIVGLPGDRVTVPAHTLFVAFPVTGLTRGTATVTASLNGTTATAAITVQPPPPTIQGLSCPATLTVGATGLCTVTLNATQLTETLVPLGGSDPGVLSVPASVTVPANTLTAQFAVTALAQGSATITAGPLNGTSQSAAVQVLPPPPTIVSLTPGSATLFVGATASLTLTINAAQLTDTAIPLASSPTGIISVPATVTVPAGSLSVSVTVTGLTPGSATLTAGPLNGTQAQSTITVNQLPPTVTTLTPPSFSLPKGKAGTLTVTIAPSQPEATVVPLSSSDPLSLEVPASITVPAGATSAPFPVIARTEGSATVTAGPLNGTSQQATVTVTPPELVTLVITPPAPSIPKGQSQQFTATGTYTDATTQDLTNTATWASSDETVATITSPGGLATGLREGQVTITATVGSLSATATLTVTPPILASLAVSPANPTRTVGETAQFQATGTLTDGTTQDLTGIVAWSSSVPTVATITASGLATALRPGTTTITATHPEGFTATTTLTVIVPPPTVTSFTPASGKVATLVTLTGTHLGTMTSVTFNGMPAGFAVLSNTQVTATVPAGAKSGPLTVTTLGGTATSTGHFLALPTQDFTLVIEPTTVTAIAGTSVSLKVSTVTTGGYTGLTQLSTGSLPSGVTATFTPPFLGPNASGLLTLTVSGSASTGSFPVEVRGMATIEGTAITRTATATLSVRASGQTVLIGQVLDEDEKLLPGVSIKLGGPSPTLLTTTDAAGNFLITSPPLGTQVFLVDGSTVSIPGKSYASIPVTVTIQPGVVNTLGFTPHLHVQPSTQSLPVAPAVATPVSFANLPDFQLTIPAGVQIIGWDGQPNTQIGVRPVPLDRLAIPPPPPGVETNVVYMFSFGKVGGGTPSAPIPVTAPNTIGAYPGQQVELWYYNEAPDGSAPNAWQMFGHGTVSNDGKLIISNPGVGIPRFCCGAWSPRTPPPPPNTPPDESASDPCPDPCGGSTQGGDPVELGSGVFLHRMTDLTLPGRIRVAVTRTYRTNDPTLGPFGIGTSTSYDAYLRQKTTDLVMVFLPGNYKSRWARQPDGSFAVGDKASFRAAVLTRNADSTWTLRYKDGRRWQFNSAGWLIAQQDRNGNQLSIARDSQNRITTLREPAGRELTVSYSGTDTKIQSLQDPLGRRVTYTYDTSNRLTQVTDPAGGTWQYTYDASHRILTVTNSRGILQTQNTYDASGRVATQTLADGGVTRFDYTVVAGTIAATQVTDPLGNIRRYRFTGGYATERTDALGQAEKTTRAPATNLVQARVDRLGRATSYAYDAAGNITEMEDALGQARTATYDPVFNQVLTSTDALGQTTTFAYDAKGNRTTITEPLGHTTIFAYNQFGQPMSVTDALGQTTTYEYDGIGNLIATVDPLGNRTERTYDAVSRLIAMKDPKGTVTRFAYDALDRLVTITDALGGRTSFTYDPMGNLLTLTDARGNTTTHTYDGMNRLVTRTDPLGRTESYTYDFNGNLRAVTDRKGQVTTHTYDSQNRRIRSDYADATFVTYEYDPAGRLLTATDSRTGAVTNTYDALGRLKAQVTPQGAITYTYDALGRRQGMEVNGLPPVEYQYDANNRLIQIQQAAQSVALTYDAKNRRTTLALPNGVTTTYTYDAASRLTALSYAAPGGPLGDLTYGYDANGNRIATGGSWARSGIPATVASSSYDAANQQLGFGTVTQAFDPNGNLLSQTDASGATTYTWDARNRLVAITGPSVSATFAYDALGRRIAKTINGEATTYHYDGLDIVQEKGPSGDASYLRTLAIDETLSRSDASGTFTYLADTLGSTVALADSNPDVATTYTYEPFGRTHATGAPHPNPFQFTGRENDDTRLYFYRMRYYDPVGGRFVQHDPLAVADGLYLYTYSKASPLKFRDPLGLTDFPSGTFGDYGHSLADAVGTMTTAADLGITLAQAALGKVPTSGPAAVAVGVSVAADVVGFSSSFGSPLIGGASDYISIGAGVVGTTAAVIAGSASSVALSSLGLGVSVGTLVNREILDKRPGGNPVENWFCSVFFECDLGVSSSCPRQ